MTDPLVFIATCDLVGLTRGRSIRPAELERRRSTGVGWVPADLALTTFGDIADPNVFGSFGDTRLVPDGAGARLPAVADRPATDLVLASIVETDGSPWRCCPRTALADAVDALEARGLRLRVAFEQEFTLRGLGSPGAPFSIESHRAAEPFGSELVAALAAAGLEPETWLPEYGAEQYEITMAPAEPLEAADRAILARAIVRDLATAHGLRATFAPLVRPDGVGNGVHIHLSLWDADGRPVTVDPAPPRPAEARTPGTTPAGATPGPTETAGRFVAGILAHAPALVAWTAPSVISSLRLTPHRWSTAAAFFGRQDREAMVRLCPPMTVGGGDGLAGANLEYRAADAAANPWLALAALVRAGLEGLDGSLPPAPLLDQDVNSMAASEREALGVTELPADLGAALDALEADDTARRWFDADLLATHLGVRRKELAILEGLTDAERCARYADVL